MRMAATRKSPIEAELARLKQEIALNREFVDEREALFLSVTWTWLSIEKAGRGFFAQFGTTDVQFNALMILWDYRARVLKQHELADLLVVNRASAGGVIDRLQRNGWVRREVDAEDRRAFRVHLTDEGIAKMKEVRREYYKLLATVLGDIDPGTLATVLRFNDAFRARLREVSK
jgi:DNA-binding MarR family transcriptional regulator